MNTTDNDPTLDAATAAALIDQQRTRTTRRETRNTAVIVATWGIVWLVGYLAVWSGTAGGNPWFRLPAGVEWWTLGGLIVAGIVLSATLGIATGSGQRGPSTRLGALYGISFGIGTVTLMLFDIGLVRAGITAEQASLLFPGTFTLLIAALYMAGSGASVRPRIDVAQYVTGALLAASVVVATFVGTPHHLLVYAAAGLVFLADAWVMLHRGL